jgi:hypothetical protein
MEEVPHCLPGAESTYQANNKFAPRTQQPGKAAGGRTEILHAVENPEIGEGAVKQLCFPDI